MINGVINVYKEKGYTSHDVVAVLRGIFRQKKIGHTGTLDPDATGVLPVCLGKATKLCDMLTDKDKEYETVLLLGKTTDTQDISGNVINSIDYSELEITPEKVKEVIYSFVGEYNQLPPMYSALKVNGKKLYELARAGVEVERKTRLVNIIDIKILDISLPRVRFLVNCSKGTYIRTLCNDIGEKLGCGGCMEELIRTRVDIFEIENSLKISEIEDKVINGSVMENMIPIDEIFPKYPKVIISKEYNKLIYNGANFSKENVLNFSNDFEKSNVRVYDEDGNFVGIYGFNPEKSAFVNVKMFLDI